ncbi:MULTISPECIES: phage tail protein [unclassified Clostridium]|uniref:phage tail protein n=1 Tax=unclassified Clostridium TaxID=2614128 RepID=UPI00207A2930|nr:phage tail protein [Clostridium sp. RO3]
MAEKFYSILTNIGKAKVANSIGLGTKVNFSKMKVGDGGGAYYEPTEDQTDLKNVVWEGNINHVTVDEKNPNWIHIEVMIPSTVGGFTIREYGAFDDENNIIGICKCAETYKPVIADGSTKELLLDLILCVVNTDTVELKIDPTIIFAKKGEVEQLRTDINIQLKDIANDSYPIVEATGTNSYLGSSARITKLSKGTRCTLFVATDSTGNCSLNLNNYGAKNIKDSFGNIVTNLKANIPYNLCYNGSDFILQGKGGGGNATPNQVLLNSTFTNDSGPQTGTMPNQGSKTASLNCGGSYIIPAGYHNGSGKVTANSLASQTSANATASQILSGFSAWVNGNKINGSATIESLGGKKFKSGTLNISNLQTKSYNVVKLENNTLTGSTGNLKEISLQLDFVAKFVIIYVGDYTSSISVKFNDICTVIHDEDDDKYDRVEHYRVNQNSNTIPINLSGKNTFTYYAFGD